MGTILSLEKRSTESALAAWLNRVQRSGSFKRETRISHLIYCSQGIEEPGFPVDHHLRESPHIRGDHRRSAGQSFEGGQPEGFVLARQEKEVRTGQEFIYGLVLPQEEHLIGHPQLLAFSSPLGLSGPSPTRTSLDGTSRLIFGEDLHNIRDPLHRPEVGDVHDDLLALGSQGGAVTGLLAPSGKSWDR